MFGRRCDAVAVTAAVLCAMFTAVMTSTTSTCDPLFDDVASRTLMSSVVFHATVTQSTTVNPHAPPTTAGNDNDNEREFIQRA